MKILILPIICFFLGCSLKIPNVETHTISYDHKYPWLEQPMYDAVDFWSNHDGYFIVMAEHESGIFIDVKDSFPNNDRIAQCAVHNWYGTIDILNSRFDNDVLENTCLLAHEMGHAFGLTHVLQSDSLMNPVVFADHENGSCFWSSADQKEFDRIKYE